MVSVKIMMHFTRDHQRFLFYFFFWEFLAYFEKNFRLPKFWVFDFVLDAPSYVKILLNPYLHPNLEHLPESLCTFSQEKKYQSLFHNHFKLLFQEPYKPEFLAQYTSNSLRTDKNQNPLILRLDFHLFLWVIYYRVLYLDELNPFDEESSLPH